MSDGTPYRSNLMKDTPYHELTHLFGYNQHCSNYVKALDEASKLLPKDKDCIAWPGGLSTHICNKCEQTIKHLISNIEIKHSIKITR